MKTDILIAGSGCAGLYCALKLPAEKQILLITKADLESNDSYLAQGGMCMLKDEDDYEAYFEDTLRAGHYENDRKSVEIMIRSSGDVVEDLLKIGVDFERDEDGSLAFTKEGAHSESRVLFHEDITGKEITSKLLAAVRKRSNITLLEYTTLVDIICCGNRCVGAVVRMKDGSLAACSAGDVVLACGGIGGLYEHSTNYRHLTGDAIAIAIKHGIACRDLDYVQIHPTTLYDEADGRSFLISESVRGEGARLYDKNMERFADELMPRDRLTAAIKKQMEKDGTEFVWEDLRGIPDEEIENHFPNIAGHCRQMGYDVTKECIPVVPAQHYFMGGIQVDHQGRTSMDRLYAVGETACNGVHGRNRLASNSLLESLVFAGRAAQDMASRGAEGAGADVDAKAGDIGVDARTGRAAFHAGAKAGVAGAGAKDETVAGAAAEGASADMKAEAGDANAAANAKAEDVSQYVNLEDYKDAKQLERLYRQLVFDKMEETARRREENV